MSDHTLRNSRTSIWRSCNGNSRKLIGRKSKLSRGLMPSSSLVRPSDLGHEIVTGVRFGSPRFSFSSIVDHKEFLCFLRLFYDYKLSICFRSSSIIPKKKHPILSVSTGAIHPNRRPYLQILLFRRQESCIRIHELKETYRS